MTWTKLKTTVAVGMIALLAAGTATLTVQRAKNKLESRGFMVRFFGRYMKSITKPWHMLFVGFIFGIGFDTATEVLLLAAISAAATTGLPWFAPAKSCSRWKASRLNLRRKPCD